MCSSWGENVFYGYIGKTLTLKVFRWKAAVFFYIIRKRNCLPKTTRWCSGWGQCMLWVYRGRFVFPEDNAVVSRLVKVYPMDGYIGSILFLKHFDEMQRWFLKNNSVVFGWTELYPVDVYQDEISLWPLQQRGKSLF